jgi:diguanylate cyclase (GGDEF)-like protein
MLEAPCLNKAIVKEIKYVCIEYHGIEMPDANKSKIANSRIPEHYTPFPKRGRTLQQTLFWFISALLVLLLLGSYLLNVSATREYLQKQLSSHAQDTATSLGLSLSAAIDARDKVAASRMIDAIFDSGDYKKIVLFDLKGEGMVIRHHDSSVDGVPAWFIELLHLKAPSKSAQVMSGWSQLGTLVVESHPGYAYLELWRVIQTQSLWFILIAIVGLLVARFLLQGLLRPLKDLELHAREMSLRHFDVRASYPKARELASVAQAMNEMADQLGGVFQEQLDLIEGLREQSFIDPLTGLSNREGFDGRLKTELDSQQYMAQGSLVLLHLNGLGQVNEVKGRVFGNELLKSISKLLKKAVHQNQDAFTARRSGADFSLFLPRVMEEDIDVFTQKLVSELCSLGELKQLLKDDSLHVGVACVRVEDTARTLLSKADMALRQAQGNIGSGWQRYANIELAEETIKEVRQANEWRSILQDVLATGRILLHTQTVFDAQRNVLYKQVLSRIELDDELIVAGLFLPMAERFELMVPFDQLVVEKVIGALSGVDMMSAKPRDLSSPFPSNEVTQYCLTLSESALIDERFLDWFDQQMSAHPLVAQLLMIEVTEHIVSYNEAALLSLSELALRHGFKLSIERFGVSSVPFSYLQRIPIDIIKVDHSFIRDVQGNQSNQFFLRSAVQIAHGQSIKVIAVGVESEDELQTLRSLGLDGAMGYFLERPKANGVFSAV